MTDLNALAERLERRAASFDAEGLKHRQALETCHGSFASDFAGWASHAEANAELDRQAAQALRGMGELVSLCEHMVVQIDSEFGLCRDDVNAILADPDEAESYAALIAARSALKGRDGLE